MPIDLQEITLSDEQKKRVAALAEQTGRPWQEVLDERIKAAKSQATASDDSSNGRFIEDREKRKAHFLKWVSQQTSHNPNFDDSRDSIYD